MIYRTNKKLAEAVTSSEHQNNTVNAFMKEYSSEQLPLPQIYTEKTVAQSLSINYTSL